MPRYWIKSSKDAVTKAQRQFEGVGQCVGQRVHHRAERRRAHGDQPLRLERPKGLADRRSTYCELRRELALGRELFADGEATVDDRIA